MAKQSGLGDGLWVGGVDLGGDTQKLDRVGGGPAPWDVTDITQSAHSRVGLQRDGAFSITSYFDPAAGASHDTYSALPSTDVIATYLRGLAAGSPAASIVAKQIGYDGNRAANGGFLLTVEALPNGYGVDWGVQATAGKVSQTSAGNLGSIDLGAAKSHGLQAFLHVFSFTGTSITVTLQGSSDNGAGDAFAAITGGAFTAVSAAPAAQRIETARGQAVERYLRVVTSGTFTQATFGVVVCVPEVATVF